MIWANFFHIYQPPNWPPAIIKKVADESYRPFLDILKRHPSLKVTLNISGSLTEQLAQHKLHDIILDIKRLATLKQIEFTGTAIYHPILPLIPTEEIVRQIELNTAVNQKYFGHIYKPTGFYPPEMAYGRKAALTIQPLGFKWIIADEISSAGKLGRTRFDRRYHIINTSIDIIFRNRAISDYFAFHANPSNPGGFWDAIRDDNRSAQALVTGMDGENLGHHRKGWDAFWEQLVTAQRVQTVTISELLARYQKRETISPRRASWSSQEREIEQGSPYVLWDDPHNPIHELQWRLLRHVTSLVEEQKQNPLYMKARELLDRQLSSDQFWWASAKPWWSLDIIKRETKELVRIAQYINEKDTLTYELSHMILTTAKSWQDENKFEITANEYLNANGDTGVRYIGGRMISANK
ncbi:MAG: hypothetical protein PHY34_00105 [Patescibacteria group bacterium]|nr:hypothetical protein [Patescibacteria group bacterium]MDD5715966.1 hypothetical protein [Patescibacteria group bacterium]